MAKLRPFACAALLLAADPALARKVLIKEDPNARITGFRRVPPEVVEGLNGARLREKVRRYALEYAPVERDITYPWFVYPECDGRLVLSAQLLAPRMAQLRIECGRTP